MQILRATRKKLDPAWLEGEVSRIARCIISRLQPARLYLFGSAARDEATDQSDLDFLVVLGDELYFRHARRKLRDAYPLSQLPVDLVWVSESEFLERSSMGGVCMDAVQEGRLLFQGKK